MFILEKIKLHNVISLWFQTYNGVTESNSIQKYNIVCYLSKIQI